jgi:MYXO-CTERM domain-containing protein
MLVAGCMALAGEARGNGRFPAANYFVAGPSGRNDVLALRTTFGLVLSRDGGRSWGWVCEEAYSAVGASDPSLSIGPDGSLVIATFVGLSGSDGAYCRWARPAGAPARGYADVTNTFDGRTMVALAGPNGSDALVLSADGGRTWTAGADLPSGYFSETADIAPNDPMRVYVTGYARGGLPVLLRSDDGGRSVRETTRGFFDAQGIYLAGVDPRRPDVLYVRAAQGLGTMLLKSEDGGMSLRMIAQTRAEMVGFALSDDGDTVWIASTDRAEGIQRSVRGGPWTRVGGDVGVKCLRYHAGLLFVCADEVTDGYALGCSADDGDHIEPLLSLRRLTGAPAVCGDSTPVGSLCAPAWPAVTSQLAGIDASAPRDPVPHDAGATVADRPTPADAERDAGAAPDVTARDVPSLDVTARDAPALDATAVDVPSLDAAADAGAPTPTDGCGCRVGSTPRAGVGALPWAALALAAATRRRRGLPSRPGRW